MDSRDAGDTPVGLDDCRRMAPRKRVPLAVGLDGRPVTLTRRRVRRRKVHSPSNVADGEIGLRVVQIVDQWEAYDALPPLVREYVALHMPIDQAMPDVLKQWQRSQQLHHASPEEFVQYLEHVSVQYLNITKSIWPVQPPDLTKVPRYQ